MSRKSNNTSSPPASVAVESMAFDGSKHGKRKHHLNHAHDTAPKNNPQTQKRRKTLVDDTVNESMIGEVDGSKAGESKLAVTDDEDEDEAEDDSIDAAAFAPSSRATKKDNDWAGPSSEIGARSARHSSRDVSADDSTIRRGRTLRRDNGSTEQAVVDNDDYNGVNMISDCDEDDPDCEGLEERAIIESEEADNDQSMPSIHKTSIEETDDDWGDFDLGEGLFMADNPFFEEQFGRTDSSILANDADDLFQSTSMFEGFSPEPLQLQSPRRVRFITPHSEGSDVISNDGDINALFEPPPSGSLDDRSFNDADEKSCGSSSGYETDYGDTTDEEEAPAAPASATTRPEALTRLPEVPSASPSVPNTPVSARSSFRVPTTPLSSRPGPKIHTFITSSHKPSATIDRSGENMIVYGLRRLPEKKRDFKSSAISTGTSTPNSVPFFPAPTLAAVHDLSDKDYSDLMIQTPIDPVFGSGTGLAMAGLYQNGLPSPQMRDANPSPVSISFPASILETAEAVFCAEQDDDDDDDDDVEAQLHVEDFIDFGEDSSDGLQSQPETSPSSTTNHDFVKHFDPNIISAFRRGQPSGRHSHSALSLNTHAFKGGRQAAANVLLSP